MLLKLFESTDMEAAINKYVLTSEDHEEMNLSSYDTEDIYDFSFPRFVKQSRQVRVDDRLGWERSESIASFFNVLSSIIAELSLSMRQELDKYISTLTDIGYFNESELLIHINVRPFAERT